MQHLNLRAWKVHVTPKTTCPPTIRSWFDWLQAEAEENSGLLDCSCVKISEVQLLSILQAQSTNTALLGANNLNKVAKVSSFLV